MVIETSSPLNIVRKIDVDVAPQGALNNLATASNPVSSQGLDEESLAATNNTVTGNSDKTVKKNNDITNDNSKDTNNTSTVAPPSSAPYGYRRPLKRHNTIQTSSAPVATPFPKLNATSSSQLPTQSSTSNKVHLLTGPLRKKCKGDETNQSSDNSPNLSNEPIPNQYKHDATRLASGIGRGLLRKPFNTQVVVPKFRPPYVAVGNPPIDKKSIEREEKLDDLKKLGQENTTFPGKIASNVYGSTQTLPHLNRNSSAIPGFNGEVAPRVHGDQSEETGQPSRPLPPFANKTRETRREYSTDSLASNQRRESRWGEPTQEYMNVGPKSNDFVHGSAPMPPFKRYEQRGNYRDAFRGANGHNRSDFHNSRNLESSDHRLVRNNQAPWENQAHRGNTTKPENDINQRYGIEENHDRRYDDNNREARPPWMGPGGRIETESGTQPQMNQNYRENSSENRRGPVVNQWETRDDSLYKRDSNRNNGNWPMGNQQRNETQGAAPSQPQTNVQPVQSDNDRNSWRNSRNQNIWTSGQVAAKTTNEHDNNKNNFNNRFQRRKTNDKFSEFEQSWNSGRGPHSHLLINKSESASHSNVDSKGCDAQRPWDRYQDRMASPSGAYNETAADGFDDGKDIIVGKHMTSLNNNNNLNQTQPSFSSSFPFPPNFVPPPFSSFVSQTGTLTNNNTNAMYPPLPFPNPNGSIQVQPPNFNNTNNMHSVGVGYPNSFMSTMSQSYQPQTDVKSAVYSTPNFPAPLPNSANPTVSTSTWLMPSASGVQNTQTTQVYPGNNTVASLNQTQPNFMPQMPVVAAPAGVVMNQASFAPPVAQQTSLVGGVMMPQQMPPQMTYTPEQLQEYQKQWDEYRVKYEKYQQELAEYNKQVQLLNSTSSNSVSATAQTTSTESTSVLQNQTSNSAAQVAPQVQLPNQVTSMTMPTASVMNNPVSVAQPYTFQPYASFSQQMNPASFYNIQQPSSQMIATPNPAPIVMPQQAIPSQSTFTGAPVTFPVQPPWANTMGAAQ